MPEGSILSRTAQNPTWLRVALPSIADLIFVALLGVLVFTTLSVRLLGDAGIGWHIRTGQQILAEHAIPRVDTFSSTLQGNPWFAWEWLYDVCVGELETSLGLNGVVWFTAIVIATTFAWTFQILMRRGVNLCAALGLVLLATGASMIHFLARPHVVSWLFTLAWFWILDSSEHESVTGPGSSVRRFYLLPLLMLVWVNVHGGFLVGFALLGIFWIAALWVWFRAKPDRIEEIREKIAAGKRARDLLSGGLLSLAASFINPCGWKLHAHIYSYLSNRFLMNHIEEFQSPNFHGIAQKCFAILILIALATIATHRRELSISHLLTVLFAVYTGLYASRSIPVSSILLILIIGPLLCGRGGASESALSERSASKGLADFARRGNVEPRAGFLSRMAHLDSTLHGHLWPILALLVTLTIAANGGRVGSQALMDAHFDPRRMPVAAVNYIEQPDVKGPILSADSWGGYLIYRLYPKERVVLDDRHDFYGEQFFKSYLKFIHGEPEWESFLAGREIGCILLPRAAPITTILRESKHWKAVYSDEIATLFAPAESLEVNHAR
jgi:hypothetical protein